MPGISSTDWAARGTVMSTSDRPAFDMAALPAGSSAHTMVYQSVSGIDGTATEVTGAAFLPPGTPPAGGWPVVGYAHGTVGVTSDCGSTGDPHLFGDIDGVAAQLSQGYAVVFTDYAGLRGYTSVPGGGVADTPHAYLEPKSAAFNLIDAVRAARSFLPQLSNRWVAQGDSQGGETAWAAAEYHAAYGQGLDLLGAAAIVPALEVSDVVRHAQDNSLTRDDLYLYPYVITGLAAVDPSLKIDDYLHGVMLEQRETLIACSPDSAEHKTRLQATLTGADAVPSSPEAADRLTRRLADYALPQQPTRIPLLAIYGGADEIVAPVWTESAITKGCALGDTVLRVRVEGQGHGLDPGVQLTSWIADRFAGVPAPSNC